MVIIRLQRQEQGVLYNVFRKEAALMSVKETKLVFKRFKRKAVSFDKEDTLSKGWYVQRITANSLGVRTFGISGN